MSEEQRHTAARHIAMFVHAALPGTHLNTSTYLEIVDTLLSGPLVPLLADAEARGHARGAAEAAALRERVEGLAEQWADMARDHREQGATNTALVYGAHARNLRRALDGGES